MGLIIRLIGSLAKLLTLAIVVDALLSWVPYNETVYKIRQVLQKFTDPVCEPIRGLLRPVTQRIGIDFSPVIAIFIVDFVASFLISMLVRFI